MVPSAIEVCETSSVDNRFELKCSIVIAGPFEVELASFDPFMLCNIPFPYPINSAKNPSKSNYSSPLVFFLSFLLK